MSSKESKHRSSSSSSHSGEHSSSHHDKCDARLMEALKHYDTFYDKPPPGLVKTDEERPEDCIPDLPGNEAAREFLAKAPTKGLWMPLGKEVKVMKCWRCKMYGHRTGDKECPLFLSGNKESEQFRYTHEDPMYNYVSQNKTKEKEEKVKQLQALLNESSDDESNSQSTASSSSSSSSSGDRHSRKRKRPSKKTKKHRKKDKRKKRKKK